MQWNFSEGQDGLMS